MRENKVYLRSMYVSMPKLHLDNGLIVNVFFFFFFFSSKSFPSYLSDTTWRVQLKPNRKNKTDKTLHMRETRNIIIFFFFFFFVNGLHSV